MVMMVVVWCPPGSLVANYRSGTATHRESRESTFLQTDQSDSCQNLYFQTKHWEGRMTEAKIYLGNLSYDTRERWIDVGLHSVVVVVETAEGVVLCQPAKN